MKLLAFALFDIKSGLYSQPFFHAHSGQAVRTVMDVGQDPQTTIGRHPADFALHQVGVFDDQTGMFEPMQPVSLGAVVSFLPTQKQPPLFQEQ